MSKGGVLATLDTRLTTVTALLREQQLKLTLLRGNLTMLNDKITEAQFKGTDPEKLEAYISSKARLTKEVEAQIKVVRSTEKEIEDLTLSLSIINEGKMEDSGYTVGQLKEKLISAAIQEFTDASRKAQQRMESRLRNLEKELIRIALAEPEELFLIEPQKLSELQLLKIAE